MLIKAHPSDSALRSTSSPERIEAQISLSTGVCTKPPAAKVALHRRLPGMRDQSATITALLERRGVHS